MLQERFKSETEKIFLASLEDALTIIVGKLNLFTNESDIKRLTAVKKLIDQEINALYSGLVIPIQEDMQGFAKISHEGLFTALNTATGVGYAYASLPKGTIKEIISMKEIHLVGDKGYTLTELFDNAKRAHINNYKQIIAGGLASNDGHRNIAKRLKDANARATTNMTALVHTAISSARDKADQKAYNDFDDVITGWKSIAVLDSRTSLHCAGLDGRMYYKKQGYPKYEDIPNRPPRHFRCRSRLVAQTDFKTETTRAQNGDKKGQVSSKTKFNEWFSSQSADFQRNYLGKGRYELYKSGKLQIKDFVDIKTGEKFTIQEIRDKFVGAKKTVVKPKIKDIPIVDLGHGKKFNDYLKGIKKEALLVIDKLPKPYEIKSKGSSRGSYYLDGKKLTSEGTMGSLISRDIDGTRTFLHEYGHHIDYTSHKLAGQGLTMQTSLNKEFLEARRLDIEHLKDKFKGKKMFIELKDRWKGKEEMRGMSDIFDSLSLGKFYDKYGMPGHGSRYYNAKSKSKRIHNQSKQQTETFAQLFEAYATNGKAWEEALKFYPNQARIFIGTIEEVLNG